MPDPWYSSPVLVVPVIWVLFLSGILWASQPWKIGKHAAHDQPEAGHGH